MSYHIYNCSELAFLHLLCGTNVWGFFIKYIWQIHKGFYIWINYLDRIYIAFKLY